MIANFVQHITVLPSLRLYLTLCGPLQQKGLVRLFLYNDDDEIGTVMWNYFAQSLTQTE